MYLHNYAPVPIPFQDYPAPLPIGTPLRCDVWTNHVLSIATIYNVCMGSRSIPYTTLEDEYQLVVSRADAKRCAIKALQDRHLYYDRNVKDMYHVRSVYQERAERLRPLFEAEYPELAEHYQFLGVWVQGFELWTPLRRDPRRKLNALAAQKKKVWW